MSSKTYRGPQRASEALRGPAGRSKHIKEEPTWNIRSSYKDLSRNQGAKYHNYTLSYYDLTFLQGAQSSHGWPQSAKDGPRWLFPPNKQSRSSRVCQHVRTCI
eukprot:9476537-Pyramimonas_sp.AAC.2